MIHGPDEARRAEEAAAVLFTDAISGLDAKTLDSVLADAPTTSLAGSTLETGVPVVDALIESGLASSRREARQLLSQGSVYVNGHRIDEERSLSVKDALHGRWIVIRKGKANQHVLVVES